MKTAAAKTLGVTLGLTCVAYALTWLLYSGPVFGFFYFQLGLSEPLALRLEWTVAATLVACAPLLLLRGGMSASVVALIVLGFAMLYAWFDQVWYPWLTPIAWGARLVLPLGWVALHVGERRIARRVLIVGIVATFAAHAIEALLLKPAFIDYILGTSRRFGVTSTTQSDAHTMLYAIGVADLLACVLVLVPKTRRIGLIWMAVWGAVTAFARPTTYGSHGLLEAAIRVAHVGVPVTILMLRDFDHDE